MVKIKHAGEMNAFKQFPDMYIYFYMAKGQAKGCQVLKILGFLRDLDFFQYSTDLDDPL